MNWFKRPVRVVEKRVVVKDSRADSYDRMHRMVRDECEQHHKITMGADWYPGFSGNIRFWCETCRSPWPCNFLRFASRLVGLVEWTAEPLTYDATAEQS